MTQFKLKNFTLSFFNNDINNSYNHDEKYKSWSRYRDTISKFISKQISANSKTIMILGSGKCNDVDLKFLCDNFERIVLSDVDISSIEDGISFQQLSDKDMKKIELVQADYTGLQDADFFAKLESLIKSEHSEHAISSFIKSSIHSLDISNILLEYKGEFDIVLSCPTYTQLLYTQCEIFMQILSQYKIYSDSDLVKIDRTFKKSMTQILHNYNNLALSLMKSDGKIIMLTDIIELAKSEELNSSIKKLLSANPIDVRQLEKHITKHGLAFAKNGRNDLLDKIIEQNAIYSFWPFDRYKDYLVYGVCGQKLENQ